MATVLVIATTLSATREASAQECNLSGKAISYVFRICLSTGCQQGPARLMIIGNRAMLNDETLNTGRIYYIGRTIDATADDAQKFGSTLRPLPGSRYYRVLLTASYTNNRLVLKDDEYFILANSPYSNPSVITITSRFTIVGCSACYGDYMFAARLNDGRVEQRRGEIINCSIGVIQ